MHNLIDQHNKEIDQAIIVTLNENTHAIDLQKTGDIYGEDTFLNVTDYSEKKRTIFCS